MVFSTEHHSTLPNLLLLELRWNTSALPGSDLTPAHHTPTALITARFFSLSLPVWPWTYPTDTSHRYRYNLFTMSLTPNEKAIF